MIVRIVHTTEYSYSEPVFLEPHTLRLTPRRVGLPSGLNWKICITPEPAGMSRNVEHNGTIAHQIWFNDSTENLSIVSDVTVKVCDQNPFDFLIYPDEARWIPFQYPQGQTEGLDEGLLELTSSPDIKSYAKKVLDRTNRETLLFLTELARQMYSDFTYEYREDGPPFSPEEMFKSRKGSCRDWAALYLAMCRGLGLASRFVSGYFLDSEMKDLPELHSWVEVYIPGGGWKGFDPTNGIVVGGRHIVLASAAHYDLTASVIGNYRGKATSKLKTQIHYEKPDTQEASK